MKRSTSGVFLVLGVSVCLSGLAGGCGGGVDREPVYPVKGKVTYKDQPVEGARVTFHPQGRFTTIPGGTTDAGGNYQLTTFDTNDGAPAGEYIVTIMKSEEMGSEEDFDPCNPGEAYDRAMQGVDEVDIADTTTLPAKYATPVDSPEKRTVMEGPNEFNFDLTD